MTVDLKPEIQKFCINISNEAGFGETQEELDLFYEFERQATRLADEYYAKAKVLYEKSRG